MRKPTMPMLALAALAATTYGLGLYAGERAAEVKRLIAEIDAHEQAIPMLEAELAYRARPERIQALAGRHMVLRPPTPEQILPDIALLPDAGGRLDASARAALGGNEERDL